MGKTIFIPEGYLMFFAAGHQAQRKVKKLQFYRLEEIFSETIRDSAKVVFIKGDASENYFYVENNEIIAYPNSEYEKLFYKYKDEIIKIIESAYGEYHYEHAAGVVDEVKQEWKRRTKVL